MTYVLYLFEERASTVAKTCSTLSHNPFLNSLFRIDLFSQPGQRVAQSSDLFVGRGGGTQQTEESIGTQEQNTTKTEVSHNAPPPHHHTTTTSPYFVFALLQLFGRFRVHFLKHSMFVTLHFFQHPFFQTRWSIFSPPCRPPFGARAWSIHSTYDTAAERERQKKKKNNNNNNNNNNNKKRE